MKIIKKIRELNNECLKNYIGLKNKKNNNDKNINNNLSKINVDSDTIKSINESIKINPSLIRLKQTHKILQNLKNLYSNFFSDD